MTSGYPDRTLIDRLLTPEAFPHTVDRLQLMETHISWVILTGRYAYKIKKPVLFDFVDYSSLQLRRTNCNRELELNRRFAPEIYLDVVPIFEIEGKPVVGSGRLEHSTGYEPEESFHNRLRDGWKNRAGCGEGTKTAKSDVRKQEPIVSAVDEPIEYAVKMVQFPQESIVAARLDHPELTAQTVEGLGRDIATFHRSLQPVFRPLTIQDDATANFPVLLESMPPSWRREALERLRNWTAEQARLMESQFVGRSESGKVRNCHGDLHLKNIIQWKGRLVPFDGIEFNEQLQFIDVLSEIAFPAIDFIARKRPDFGWRLLNAYLEDSGDYRGAGPLRFFLVYRAMVRAKVTWLNPSNHQQPCQEETGDADKLNGPWDKYIQAAITVAFDLQPSISIMHGFSGSGKSTIAMNLIEANGGLRIRSDAERRRLQAETSASMKYSDAAKDQVYAELVDLAGVIATGGFPVVVDATFLKKRHRDMFCSLAAGLNVPFQIVDCDAPFERLRQRIANRQNDPSEADVEVLKRQVESHEALTRDEFRFVRKVDSS
jgi:aminoglycoside phosphotransferase family enzyme/predicted kinase